MDGLADFLADVMDYLDGRADVSDGHPNTAMRLYCEAERLAKHLPEPEPFSHPCHCNCPTGDCRNPVLCAPLVKDGCTWLVCPEFPHICHFCARGEHSLTYTVAAPSEGVR